MLAPIVYNSYAVVAYTVAILVLLYRAIITRRAVCRAPFPKAIIKRTHAPANSTSIICSRSASLFACIHGYAPFHSLKIGGYRRFALWPVKVVQHFCYHYHNILTARPVVKTRPTPAILSIISIIYTRFKPMCRKSSIYKGLRPVFA